MLVASSVLRNHGQQSCKLDFEQGCFMSRGLDISFGMESPIGCEVHSPTFTCQSSFSSFLSNQFAPSTEAGGFSFHGSSGSNTLEYKSPFLALPSFDFFSSSCAVEQQTDALVLPTTSSTVNSIPTENGSSKAGEDKKVGSGGGRALCIQSRRNNTIGLCEFKHLELMVTESVIRWASCTRLPTATSFRSSLVC